MSEENEQVLVAKRTLAQVKKAIEYAQAAEAARSEQAKSLGARDAVQERRERGRQRRMVRDNEAQLELIGGDRAVHEGIKMPAIVGGGASVERTIDVGAEAEERAFRFLTERGYRIFERNYKCDLGELDMVARHEDDLVFIEVRSRTNEDYDAIDSIGARKRRQVTRVAEVYLLHRQPDFETCRFDIVAIDGERITLYEDAWRLGGIL